MLVQHELGKMIREGPKRQLSMRVDDLSIGLTRPTVERITTDMVLVAGKAKFIMEEFLYLPLAASKVQVIASSLELEQAIQMC